LNKRRRRLVDAGVGRLRRQHDRHQQREGIDVLQFAARIGIGGLEAAERFLDLGFAPLRQLAVGGFLVGLNLRLGAFDVRRFALAGRLQALLNGLPLGGFARHLSRIIAAMTSDNTSHSIVPSAEPAIFSAVITPHRSLGSTGFLILMLAIGGVSFVSGMVFLLLGAWPIFGFLGLDVLLVYVAFRANFRAARAYEEVIVTSSELTLRKVNPGGRVRQWTLNPLWVRLERIVHDEFGIERLFLVSRGRRTCRPIAVVPQPRREGGLRQGAVVGARRSACLAKRLSAAVTMRGVLRSQFMSQSVDQQLRHGREAISTHATRGHRRMVR
jgi:uncharacterized membrane protein